MQSVFLSKFEKDLSKINLKSILKDIEDAIYIVDNAQSLKEIPHLKKLKGFKNAYRIKIGNYRIGVFIENDILEFARVVHRKDIYNLFP